MAMMRREPGAMVRRYTTWALAADVAVGLILGLIFGTVVGVVLFLIGLVVTGFAYFNTRQVLRTRGRR